MAETDMLVLAALAAGGVGAVLAFWRLRRRSGGPRQSYDEKVEALIKKAVRIAVTDEVAAARADTAPQIKKMEDRWDGRADDLDRRLTMASDAVAGLQAVVKLQGEAMKSAMEVAGRAEAKAAEQKPPALDHELAARVKTVEGITGLAREEIGELKAVVEALRVKAAGPSAETKGPAPTTPGNLEALLAGVLEKLNGPVVSGPPTANAPPAPTEPEGDEDLVGEADSAARGRPARKTSAPKKDFDLTIKQLADRLDQIDTAIYSKIRSDKLLWLASGFGAVDRSGLCELANQRGIRVTLNTIEADATALRLQKIPVEGRIYYSRTADSVPPGP